MLPILSMKVELLFFWWDWDLNSGLWPFKAGAIPLEYTSSPFCPGYFGDGVSWTICLGWPWTLILPISGL
jgi:hypothetical protein